MTKVMLALTRIVQEVALLKTPASQVQKIVDSVKDVINIDVCSLYRKNQNGEMVLLASHGLITNQPVKIPPQKGLVGLVEKSCHPINIADATNHPDYYYVPQTKEERFRSFCGVPLVCFGEVIGVLVVQRKKRIKLSNDDEAFLVTLASHLALIIADISPQINQPQQINVHIEGVSGSPGIGIGTVKLCHSDSIHDVVDALCRDADAEISQWHLLLNLTIADIKSEQAALGSELSDSVAGIFDAYQMLLSDQALSEQVELEIRAGFNLPTALKHSIHYFSELFRAMDDAYLKARHEDILHLGNKLHQVWCGAHLDKQKSEPPGEEQVVLMGAHISASDIAAVSVGKLAGIVSFDGSVLSHTAVLANALGVPAVMGVGEIKGLVTGERLIVDGNTGQIILYPGSVVIAEFEQLISKERFLVHRLDGLRELPATTRDGVRIRLLTNTGLLADIQPGIRSGAEGVGLYRTEIPFMVRQSFPTEDEQVQVYQAVFAAYQGKPVYVRTLDIGGDKQLPYFLITDEENPALGWRGIRFSLDNLQLLMTQVRAIIRAAEGKENLHILLPMVSSTMELVQFQQLLNDACDQLAQEGLTVLKPKVGVMVEVPAAISQLPLWKDRIDFISIGSNDLSQYLLALDRNNARVASRFDHIHPAVLHEIHRIANIAQACNLPLNICGEMASDPVAVLALLGMGVRSLSLSSAKLPRIKWLIRSVSIAEAEAFFTRSLQKDNVEGIRMLGAETLNSLGLSELLN